MVGKISKSGLIEAKMLKQASECSILLGNVDSKALPVLPENKMAIPKKQSRLQQVHSHASNDGSCGNDNTAVNADNDDNNGTDEKMDFSRVRKSAGCCLVM